MTSTNFVGLLPRVPIKGPYHGSMYQVGTGPEHFQFGTWLATTNMTICSMTKVELLFSTETTIITHKWLICFRR